MSTAIYIRVSTKEQNADTQQRVLDDYCSRHNIQAVTYRDEGYSGDTVSRPEFRRLRDDIRSGRVSHVLVFRLDRISRRTATGVAILHDWLDNDVRVTSVMENLDIDPSNHAVVDIVVPLLFGLAANEQRVRKQRQKVGIDRAKSEGKYKGRKNRFDRCEAVTSQEAQGAWTDAKRNCFDHEREQGDCLSVLKCVKKYSIKCSQAAWTLRLQVLRLALT